MLGSEEQLAGERAEGRSEGEAKERTEGEAIATARMVRALAQKLGNPGEVAASLELPVNLVNSILSRKSFGWERAEGDGCGEVAEGEWEREGVSDSSEVGEEREVMVAARVERSEGKNLEEERREGEENE